MEKNYKLTVQYDGTKYDGWQKQGNTERTIQGKLELVAGQLAGHPVEVHGAGRTDAGVHALGQVCSVRLDAELDADQLKAYMNRYLPEDIRVILAEEAAERFHSRLNAVEKTYLYRIETGEKKDVFQRKYQYGLPGSLDVAEMKAAASYLTGSHDFKSFCTLRKSRKSTVRTLREIEFDQDGTLLSVRFTGDGFLYNMVRIIMGTLIEVGQGKRKPQDMTKILDSSDRQAAGFTAPAEGLFLERVRY